MKPLFRLIALGLALETLYLLAFTRSWWLWDNFHLPSEARPPGGDDLMVYGLTITAAFALYAAASWTSRGGPSRLADITAFLFPLIFAGSLLPTMVVQSGDLFHYIMEGRIFWVHGDNPLVAVPADYPNDPYLVYSNWPNSPAPYGPLWILLTGLPTLLFGEHTARMLLGYKLLSVGFFLGTAWLIWLILAKVRPQHRRLGVILYAWNPLALLSFAVDGHNDAAMIFFAVLALYLAIRGKWQWALPALALSAMFKYVTLLLAPFLLYYGWRRTADRGRPLLTAGAILSVVLAVAIFAPLWEGLDTFKGLRVDQRGWFVYSTPEIALLELEQVISTEAAMQIARSLAAVAFLVPYGLILTRLRDHPLELTLGGHQVLFLYLLVGSVTFFPWYTLWVLPFSAILTDNRWAFTGLLLTFVASFVYVIERSVSHLGFLQGDMTLGRIVTVVVVFIPPALLWLGLAWRYRLGRPWRLAPSLIPEYKG